MNSLSIRMLTITLTVTILISFLTLLAWIWACKKEGKQYAMSKESIPVTIGVALLFGLLITKVPYSVVQKMAVGVLFIIFLPMIVSDIQTYSIPKRYALLFPVLLSGTIGMYYISFDIALLFALLFTVCITITTLSALLLYMIPAVFDGVGYADFVGFAEMVVMAIAFDITPVHLCASILICSVATLLLNKDKRHFAFVPVFLMSIPLGMLFAYI